MPHDLPELTEAEWAIIKAVWDGQPCTAPDIQERLAAERQWSYSTVRTLMDRMAAKGLLQTDRLRHLTLYRAAVTREQAQQGELGYALKTAFNGALTPMIQSLLDHHPLSERELDELAALIQAKRGRPARKKN